MPNHHSNNDNELKACVSVGCEPIICGAAGAVTITTTSYCAPAASAGALTGSFFGGACVPPVIALLCMLNGYYKTERTPELPHLQELPITGRIYRLFGGTSDTSAPTTALSPYNSGINSEDSLQSELLTGNPEDEPGSSEDESESSPLLPNNR